MWPDCLDLWSGPRRCVWWLTTSSPEEECLSSLCRWSAVVWSWRGFMEVGEGKGATGAALRPAHPAAGSSSFVRDAPDSPYGGCIIFLSAISCTEKWEPKATAPTSPGVVLAGAAATDVLAPPHHRPLPDGRAPRFGGCSATYPFSLGMQHEQFPICFLSLVLQIFLWWLLAQLQGRCW